MAYGYYLALVWLKLGCCIIGLLSYIWAFISQRHKLPAFKDFLVLSCTCRTSKIHGAQNIYYAAFSLLLFDGFTVIFGLVPDIYMLNGSFPWFFYQFTMYCNYISLATRYLSQCQHLITALISILFAYRPTWGDCLYATSIGLNVIPFNLVILSFTFNGNILFGLDVYNFLLVVAIVISCALPSSSPIARDRNGFGKMAVAFYLLVCLPTVIGNYLVTQSDVDYYLLPVNGDVDLFTTFYIIMNALLFRMVLKLEEEDHSDTHQNECAIQSVSNANANEIFLKQHPTFPLD